MDSNHDTIRNNAKLIETFFVMFPVVSWFHFKIILFGCLNFKSFRFTFLQTAFFFNKIFT
jgi:hypothetical protein